MAVKWSVWSFLNHKSVLAVQKLMKWAEDQAVTLLHIQPGQPQPNACIERYNRTILHERMDQYIIESGMIGDVSVSA